MMNSQGKSALWRIGVGAVALVGLAMVGQALAQAVPERTIDLAAKAGQPGPVSLFDLILSGIITYPPLRISPAR